MARIEHQIFGALLKRRLSLALDQMVWNWFVDLIFAASRIKPGTKWAEDQFCFDLERILDPDINLSTDIGLHLNALDEEQRRIPRPIRNQATLSKFSMGRNFVDDFDFGRSMLHFVDFVDGNENSACQSQRFLSTNCSTNSSGLFLQLEVSSFPGMEHI